MSFQRILFLCTGNYYRSRFAEELFNHLADKCGLAWRADSSGLNVAYGETVNVGPISRYTVEAMTTRALPLPAAWRRPKQTTECELLASDLVIALKEAEHRPLMQKHFPRWTDRISYWHIHDLDAAPPDEALSGVEKHVAELIDDLRQQSARSVAPGHRAK